MINKRLLIKNLLAHNDECSFYDKKRQLNLHTKEGKAKFLKHICALSNSNPSNNSYIVVGVEDQDNEIMGDDFFDDSRIQNLVNAYFGKSAQNSIRKCAFSQFAQRQSSGFGYYKTQAQNFFFKKNIHTILANTVFVRVGSNSMPTEDKIPYSKQNIETVIRIENNSRNSIAHTLDGVMDFMNVRHGDMPSKYKVFKELFVICWAGIPKKIRDTTYLSRVDIELINEQVKLFYSALDVVSIQYDEHSFTIIEHVPLGLNDKTSFYPLEQLTIHFFDNGYYKMETQMLFEPPAYNKKMLHHIYNSNLALINKLQKSITLSEREEKDLEFLSSTLMICYLNGFEEAKQKLIEAKPFLKAQKKANVYLSFKEAMRILRK